MKLVQKETGSEGTQIAIAIAVLSALSIGMYTRLAPHIKGIIDKVINALTS